MQEEKAPSGVGQRIKEARERSEMSQRDLSKAIGVSASVIQKVESGAIQSPDAELVARAARALNVSVEWLMAGPEGSVPTFE